MRRFTLPFLFAAIVSIPAFASVDKDLLAIAPAGSTVLTGIDLNRAKTSRFGTYMLKEMRSGDSRFGRFTAATSLDPQRDLDQLLLAGIAGKGGPDARFAIFARGTFDPAATRAAILAQGGSLSALNGIQALIMPGRHDRNQEALAFPRPSIAVFGDLNTVEDVLSTRTSNAGAPDSAIDAQLLDQVNQIGPANDIWFATLMSGSFLGRALAGAAPPSMVTAGVLRSILRSSGGMQLGTTVMMSLNLFTRSAEDAQAVAELLRFAAGLLQMQHTARSRIAAAALNNLQAEADGQIVRATLNVNEDQLEQFVRADQKPAVSQP